MASSETESDTENLLEDSDTEYTVEEPIPDNIEENYQFLTPEATVHVEGEILDIDQPPAKKFKKKVVEFHKYVLFHKVTMCHSLPLQLPAMTLNNIEIKRENSVKFLGVIIDENLTWKTHTEVIENNISENIGVLDMG